MDASLVSNIAIKSPEMREAFTNKIIDEPSLNALLVINKVGETTTRVITVRQHPY